MFSISQLSYIREDLLNQALDKQNIFVVDDLPENLILLRTILEKKGYRITTFENGIEALEVMKAKVPDLVLLDVDMPVIDGYEVCSRMKMDESLEDIPVIFISAFGETFNKVKAFKSGAVDYVEKPFSLDELLARIRVQLDLKDRNEKLEKAIEELRKTQEILIRSEKMASMGVMLAGMSHEINNPVNYIKTSTEALIRDFNDFKKINDFCISNIDSSPSVLQELEHIKQSCEYEVLTREIDDLMKHITIGSGRITDVVRQLKLFAEIGAEGRDSYNINEGLDNGLDLLGGKVEEHGITVVRNFALTSTVEGDRIKLNQAFLNILSNAVGALENTPNGEPLIAITTSEVRLDGLSHVEVSIQDNGVGVPVEFREKVFDPFFTTKEVGCGLGLGLSIVHKVVEEHNGKLILDSNEQGTTVIIRFPIEQRN